MNFFQPHFWRTIYLLFCIKSFKFDPNILRDLLTYGTYIILWLYRISYISYFRGSSRYDYTHEILANDISLSSVFPSTINETKVRKSRRISVVCRNDPWSGFWPFCKNNQLFPGKWSVKIQYHKKPWSVLEIHFFRKGLIFYSFLLFFHCWGFYVYIQKKGTIRIFWPGFLWVTVGFHELALWKKEQQKIELKFIYYTHRLIWTIYDLEKLNSKRFHEMNFFNTVIQ